LSDDWRAVFVEQETDLIELSTEYAEHPIFRGLRHSFAD